MTAKKRTERSTYEQEIDAIKNILLKDQMSDDDLLTVKRFIFQDYDLDKIKDIKELLRERIIMLAYLLDV